MTTKVVSALHWNRFPCFFLSCLMCIFGVFHLCFLFFDRCCRCCHVFRWSMSHKCFVKSMAAYVHHVSLDGFGRFGMCLHLYIQLCVTCVSHTHHTYLWHVRSWGNYYLCFPSWKNGSIFGRLIGVDSLLDVRRILFIQFTHVVISMLCQCMSESLVLGFSYKVV